MSNDETIEMNIIDSIDVKLGLKDVYLEQCHIFSNLDRDPDDRIIAISYIGLIDNVSALLKEKIGMIFKQLGLKLMMYQKWLMIMLEY